MQRKENLTLITDWLPLLIDGHHVAVYFPSAYETPMEEPKPEAIEQTLIAAYKKSSVTENKQ